MKRSLSASTSDIRISQGSQVLWGSSKSPFKDASQDWTDFWGDAAMDILRFVSKVEDEFDLVKKNESFIFGLKCICFSIESSRLLEVMEEYHQYW